MKKVLMLVLVAISSLFAAESHASTTCQSTDQGQLCTSQVDFTQFAQQAYMIQYESEWCWAASISMVFSFYNHPVSQPRIVSSVYGAPENIPAQAGITIAQELNRGWTDDNGAPFTSTLTGVFDAQAGVDTLSNQQIIAELDANHPMVLGARTHAMVLTEIQYFITPEGPNVVAAGVFDPWPGMGARALQMDELTPAPAGGSLIFLATVRLAEGLPQAAYPSATSGPCSFSHKSAGAAPPFAVALMAMAMVISLVTRRRS